MASLTPGTQVGRYRVEAEAGRGGMGVVYRAVDPALNRPVALKLLSPHIAGEGRSLARFGREAAALAQLKHPHIALVYEFGEHAGQPFIALEWVNGRTLRDVLDEQHRLPLPRALKILAQVADALDYAHARGVIHRDIKPSNILVDADDNATLVDFGLARMTEAPAITAGSEFFGTPHYLAPELITGHGVDGRVDLYCLALVAYDLLAGHTPFEAATWPALVHAHLYDAPTPITELNPTLPAAVETALLKALAKDPAQRFATAGEFMAALRSGETAAPRTVRPKVGPAPVAIYAQPTQPSAKAARPAPPAPAPDGAPTHQTGFIITLAAVLLVMVASALLWLRPRLSWPMLSATPGNPPPTVVVSVFTETPEPSSPAATAAATTPVSEPSPASETAIEFLPGGTLGQAEGQLQAGESRVFTVKALEAQPSLIVSLDSPGQDVYLGLAGPASLPPLLSPTDRQTTWQGLLPLPATYTLTANAGGPASSFQLSVDLPHRITFAPGAISYVVNNTTPVSQPVAYVLRALADQTLTATLTSPAQPVYLSLYGLQDGQPLVRSAMNLAAATVKLPATEDYILQAIPGGIEATTYTLTITVVSPTDALRPVKDATPTVSPGGLARPPALVSYGRE